MVKTILEGSIAVGEAVKLCMPGVVAAYPITPQTHIIEHIAELVANGEMDTEYIPVESEHSAMSACLGASAAGVRVYTSTSSQGLALMHEMLFIVSGMRLPVVMTNANRALSAPISIWNDQQDSMAERDTGWIQFYAETAQEAVDCTIQAYKIAENHKVLLPVMVNIDGFSLTHTVEPVDLPPQAEVDEFLPEYKPLYNLDPENPMTFGPIGFPDAYMEFRKQQWDAMNFSPEVIQKAYDEFSEKFKRGYSGDGERYGYDGTGNAFIEKYKMEDADYAIITLGSLSGTIKDTIDTLRKEGKKVGLIKVRTFRPFPKEHIKKALSGVNAVGVVEKDVTLNVGGALWLEIKAFMRDTPIYNFIVGLGGRDVRKSDIKMIFGEIESKKADDVNWIGVNV